MLAHNPLVYFLVLICLNHSHMSIFNLTFEIGPSNMPRMSNCRYFPYSQSTTPWWNLKIHILICYFKGLVSELPSNLELSHLLVIKIDNWRLLLIAKKLYAPAPIMTLFNMIFAEACTTTKMTKCTIVCSKQYSSDWVFVRNFKGGSRMLCLARCRSLPHNCE